jgi:hypothetical protein
MRFILNKPVIAFYPLLLILGSSLMHALGADDFMPPTFGFSQEFGEFVVSYWWLLLGIPAVLIVLVYIVVALNNHHLTTSKRVFWFIMILLGSALTIPVYWWLYKRDS